MATSTRSSGYKKKPTSEPASKGVSKTPSNTERATHAGKTSAAKKGIELAREYETPPTTSQVQEHTGKSYGKAKRREHKELREANNTNIYQGSTAPKTQRQKQLAARGKAVRKITGIRKGEHTPYQNIKQTAILREGQKALLKESIDKLNRQINSNKLDPKSRKEKHAEAVALQAEVHRLEGRKKLGDLQKVSRSDLQTVGPTLYTPKLKGKKAASQYKAAKQDFKKFDHLQKEAVRLSEEAVSIPAAGKSFKIKIKEAAGPKNPTEPFKVPSLANAGLKGTEQFFYVPKQKIPGDKWGGEIGGQYYNRTEIEELTKGNIHVASEPSAVSDIITAASLAPIAPEAKLLQLAGKGIEAYKGVQAAKSAAKLDDLLNFSKGLSEGADSASVYRKIADTAEPALKQTVDGKIEFNVGAKLADNGAEKLSTSIGDTLPSVEKSKLVGTADKPLNKAIESHAEDPRVMSGAGAPTDVNDAMIQAAAREARKYARSSVTGLALKARRGATYAGIGAATLGPVAIASQDFREASYRDVHDLIAGFVPSSVQFLTASGDALLNGLTLGQAGSNTPLEKIWNQMKETSPFALAVQGKWSQAESAFKERPISTLIEAGGIYAGVGEAAGTVAREGLPGDLASLKGGNIEHIHGNFYKIGDKSPNLLTQGVESLRSKLAPSDIDPDKVRITRDKSGRQKIEYGSKGEALRAKLAGQKQVIELEKAIDNRQSTYLIYSRQAMKEVEHETSKLITDVSKKRHHQQHGGSALTLIASKLIRSPKTAVQDLEGWKEHLEANIASKSPHEDKSLLLENLSIVEVLLKHKDKLFNDDTLWKAAENYRKSERGRQDELVAMSAVDKDATEYAPWIPYAVHHMDAKFNLDTKQFEVDGQKLELNDIKRHAKEDGVVGEPAMITTKIMDGGNADRFEQWTLPSLDNYKSAGKAIETGDFDLASRSLIRQSIISRQIVDERNYLMSMMHDGAVRAPGQKDPIYFKSKAEAKHVNDTQFGVHGLEMEPVNMRKFVKELTSGSRMDQDVNSTRARALYKNVDEATHSALLKSDGYEDDAWVLVPKRMIERINEHQKGVRQVGRIIRRINREFKGSVLAFSPKWHVGNLVDMVTRAYFQGIGLHSYTFGRTLLREVKDADPALYNDMMAQIMGGHLKSSGDIIKQAESIDDRIFDDHQISAARAAASAFRLGGKGYRKLQELSFGIGGEFEHIARTAGLGKAARLEARRLGHSWTDTIKMQHDVLTDLTENLRTDSSVVMKYGKYVNKVFGDYTTMSPEVRFAMQTYAPFLMWLRASTKWVLTLPKESPIRTAMIASVNRLNEPERRKLGLSVFTQGAKELPEYLLGSVSASNKSELYRTQAYTSFGPLTDFEGLAEYALPQFENLIEAWGGKDWLSEEIVNPNGEKLTDPERLSILLQKTLETYVAPLGYAHKIIAHGEPSETFSVFDLDLLGKGPSAVWNAAKERKHYKNEYGYSQQEKEEIKETKPKKNIWLSTFSPTATLENPVIREEQYEKESKEGTFLKKSKKSPAEEVSENLFGASHTNKAKSDKRRKKSSNQVYSNLFE